ncbi:MAG: CHAT domain-containing protein [Acidobacteria bacterium]|nr:CHAT domain-containing protein [Acidobacteriota bacterium]MBI3657375.1 CHAT domain-containing protein [Acidobacteriota bacterium]
MGIILNNFGELYFHKQQFQTAIHYLNEAYEVKNRTKHPSYSSIAVTLRALGEVYLADNRWAEAETYITRALQEARRSQTGVFDTVVLASIYDLQGNLLAKQGRLPEAAAAFENAVDGIETELADLKSHHWKTSLLSSSQDHFHNLILLNHARLNNPVAAFEVAEKARARAFLDLVGGQIGFEYGEQLANATRTIKDVLSTVNAQPFTWAELRRKLPPTITVVEYTMTENQLLIWVLNSEGLRSRAVALSREQLDRLVDDFRIAVTLSNSDFKARFSGWKASLEETQRRASELYRRLIAPIKNLLPLDRLVCFVPDGGLYYVPFAALVDPATQKYLVEEYTIFYAPSASILARSLEMQRQKPSATPLLMISNPAMGRKALKQFRYLQPLVDAEGFDDQIAHLFKGSGFLRAAAATKSAVRAAMPNYEIVHFSAHGVLNDQEPLLSALVLAEEIGPGGLLPVKQAETVVSEDNGLLYTHELFTLSLPKTRLLVLSACETALGRLWGGEGMVGMARAVFYAGVPSLIATQWKVADGPTGQLMVAFCQELRAGATIAGALAQAQRDYLQKSTQPERRHPYYWGGFCLMGSYYLRGNHR